MTSPEDLGEAVSELLKARDKRAIPLLKEMFRAESDKLQKQRIALFLVLLTEDDDEYYDYLAAYASKAVESDIPTPLKLGDDGRVVKGELSDEFIAWCEKKGVSTEEALGKAFYLDPGDVMVLGHTADPRAFDLLKHGLESPNASIVGAAARGLGRIGDDRAIEPLIQAAARAPKAEWLSFASALAYFDDPRAWRRRGVSRKTRLSLRGFRQKREERGRR